MLGGLNLNIKKIAIAVLIVCGIMLLCVFWKNSQIKQDKKINVVTSFYPMYIATINITNGIDVINVENLASKATGCVHDYTLTTEEMVKISKADTLVINGNSMETFLNNAIQTVKNLNIIDTAVTGVYTLTEEHGINSHTFVSIKNYIAQVENLAVALKVNYPEYSEKIQRNSDIYLAKLNELLNYAQQNLNRFEGAKVVSLHDAFEYFANDFGIEVVAVIEEEEGIGASASDTAEVINLIKSQDVQALITDVDGSTNMVATIVNETKIRTCEFDSTISGDNVKDEYINKMRKNIQNLLNVLGGDNAGM